MKQLETAKPILFVIQPQSIIDVITNSSSELFVFQGNDKEVIEGMISDIYPNYRDEYDELRSIQDFNAYQMKSFISWAYEKSGDWRHDWSYECIAPKGMNIDDLTEEATDEFDKKWYKNGKKFSSKKIEEHLDEIKTALSGTYLLYSIDDNPDQDMQAALSQIGSRYHLG